MTEDEIIDTLRHWVEHYPRSYFKKVRARRNSEILKYIEEHTPMLSDPEYLISTKVYWVLNGLTQFPRCVVCGNPITKNVKATEGYPKHCSAKCLASDETVKMHKEEAFERKYGNGIVNPFQVESVKMKIASTMLRKYGNGSYTRTQEYRDKVKSIMSETNKRRNETMERNDSFRGSSLELIVGGILKKKFPDLKTQYVSEEYPFRCDFFIPSRNQYIEYNGTWTHGGHPFNEKDERDVAKLDDWKSRNSKYYENAIETWTVRDVKKRNLARDSGLNFVELWNISDAYKLAGIDIIDDLEIPFQRNRLSEEFSYFKDTFPRKLPNKVSNRNLIVKFFQQDIFYGKEKELWKNPKIREEIVSNRARYLNKSVEDMSVNEILNAFKISGIHYGYSHFNPLWFKWFIVKFGCKAVYDPFGGWGHRLLGSLSLEKYIYNDFSVKIKENVEKMIKYFKIDNVETSSNDAFGFVPQSDFDSIFTCPPYFNLEEYPCGKFENRRRFDETMMFVYDLYARMESCKTMGIVIREDFLPPNMKYSEKFPLNCSISHLSNGTKRNSEYMYIFRK